MKLYYAPGACSMSPHIALRESGLKFDIEKVDLGAKKTETGADFTKINPKGQVPTLVLDDGAVLTEGPAIVQYVADKAPAAGLAPAAGTMERYRLMEWLNFTTSELHKNMGALFNKQMPDEGKALIKGTLAKKLAYLESHFATNSFALGDRFTVADPYMFTVLGWSKFVGVDLTPYPNVGAYLGRVASRPKVQETLKAEGLA